MKAAYEINGTLTTREAFYAVACDPRRSVAVEACAGAGKTWMLVSRMIRALLDGATITAQGRVQLAIAPHEILAITFTKKAAGEMRQRLQEWLQAFVHAPVDLLQQELMARGVDEATARLAQPALAGLYDAVLGCDRPVQIRTFHSWFASLLRSAPIAVMQRLGLPVSHELLEDDAPAVALVWSRFYSKVLASPSVLADYEAVVAIHGRHQTLKALSSALAKRVEFGLADEHGIVEQSVRRFDEQFPDFAGLDEPDQRLLREEGPDRQILWTAARALGAAKAPTHREKGVELERALTDACVHAMVTALFTKEGGPRKFSDKVAGLEDVRLAQDLVQSVLDARAQAAAWAYQQRMMRLTRQLIQCFSDFKRERGWVDMNDVELAALALLGDPQWGGWMAQKLDVRIRHLLIDEFQDTNPLQWQALHGWLGSYAGAGGGALAPSVFIVGDPKQSIYRFRRAEPQVFRAAQDFVREGLGGDLLSCDHTRRNALAVMGLVNQVMWDAQQHVEYDGFRPHTTQSEELGSVARLPRVLRAQKPARDNVASAHWRDSLTTPRELAEESLSTLECRQAAAWVAQRLRQGVQAKDILVLARKRDRLSVMEQELRALHIGAQQPEKTDLADMPEVQDILALLDVLVSPTHDLSLARALRSPLLGAADDDLVHLAQLQRAWEDEPTAAVPASRVTWFELLLRAPDLPARLVPVGALLLRWQQLLRDLPPHDALVDIYAQGDVLARFAAAAPRTGRASVVANLQGLLTASLQLDASRYATPYALVRALRAGGVRAPVNAAVDAVRLLTVHGAKGLEAECVLILDADAPAPHSPSMGVLVDWPGEQLAPVRLIFLASEATPPACVASSLLAEQAARAREEVNALYVALTRAKRDLLLSGVEPARPAARSWWQRLTPFVEPIPAPEAAPDGTPDDDTWFALAVLPPLSGNRCSVVQSPTESSRQEEVSAESAVGQAMHRLLEWAPMGSSHVTPLQVRAVAGEFGLDDSQAALALSMAERVLAGQGRWAWDAALVDWHGNEVGLNWQGRSLRLDRLVRRADSQHWWVLDYKSGAQPQVQPELVQQLEDYRQAVMVAHPGQTVRCAFLTALGEFKEVL